MPRTSPAKEEIVEFLRSGEAGVVTELTEPALKRAAQSLFTEKGLDCPVQIVSNMNGTFLINRNIYKNGNSHAG